MNKRMTPEEIDAALAKIDAATGAQPAPQIERETPPAIGAGAGVAPEVRPQPEESAQEAFVVQLAKLMHTGHHWRRMLLKSGKPGLGCDHTRLTRTAVKNHVSTYDSVGLCPIVPGTDTTRTALLDFDSHKGEVPWRDMTTVADNVVREARESGLRPIAFRSSGGGGIHLLFAWEQPQDAYSVRQTLVEVLAACGLKPGTKGVINGTVEVFPKQDSVPADGFGNMWVLPFARKKKDDLTETRSVALDELLNPAPTLVPELVFSASVPVRQKPEVKRTSCAPDAPELERVVSAVQSLVKHPAVGKGFDYDDFWRPAVFAIHDATEGSEEGEQLAQWFNDNVMEHDKGRDWLSEQVWGYIRMPQPGTPMITVGTLFHLAGEAGWLDPKHSTPPSTEGFEDVEEQPKPARVKPLITWSTGIMETNYAPPEYLVEDLIPPGLFMLASPPKAGKSWFALQLAREVGAGGEFLGRKVREGVVLHIGMDDGIGHRYKRRMEVLNWSALSPEAMTRIAFAWNWHKINEGGIEDIEEWMNEHPETRLINIDLLQNMFPARRRDQEQYEHTMTALSKLKNITKRYRRLTILVLHHLRKTLDAVDVMNEVLGSVGLTGGTDGTLVLKRDRGTQLGKLHTAVRDNAEDYVIDVIHEGPWRINDVPRTEASTPDQQCVLELLREMGKAIGPREIANRLAKHPNEHMRKSPESVRQILGRLQQQQLITQVKHGHYMAGRRVQAEPMDKGLDAGDVDAGDERPAYDGIAGSELL